MADGTRLAHFRPDSAGISEIFTSGAMQAALHALGQPIASSASSAARARLHHGGFKDEGDEPYESVTEVLDHTAIEYVHPATEQGRTDLKLHHTLNGYNH